MRCWTKAILVAAVLVAVCGCGSPQPPIPSEVIYETVPEPEHTPTPVRLPDGSLPR